MVLITSPAFTAIRLANSPTVMVSPNFTSRSTGAAGLLKPCCKLERFAPLRRFSRRGASSRSSSLPRRLVLLRRARRSSPSSCSSSAACAVCEVVKCTSSCSAFFRLASSSCQRASFSSANLRASSACLAASASAFFRASSS